MGIKFRYQRHSSRIQRRILWPTNAYQTLAEWISIGFLALLHGHVLRFPTRELHRSIWEIYVLGDVIPSLYSLACLSSYQAINDLQSERIHVSIEAVSLIDPSSSKSAFSLRHNMRFLKFKVRKICVNL